MSTVTPVPFGLNHGVPEAMNAWGARYIINANGLVDFVPNRQGAVGLDTADLMTEVNKIMPEVEERISRMLVLGQIRPDEKPEDVGYHTIYDDGELVVRATPNGSCGYLYVRVWFRDEEIGDSE